MATKNKHIENISPDSFDELLAISGYSYPRTDNELELFELLHHDFDFKLKDFRVNPEEIISHSFSKKGVTITFVDIDEQKDIEELRLAARNGNEQISESILDKIKRKHSDGNKQ